MLDRVWLRNTNWCMSLSKFFPVAVTDALWQDCVRKLVPEMDAIFIDVTEVGDNVLWEVELCHALGLADRIVYLTRAADTAAAHEALRAVIPARASRPHIFFYDSACAAGAEALRERIAALAGQSARRRRPAPGTMSVVGTAMFVLGLYPLLLLSSPAIGEDLGLRWNEWDHPAHWPGLAAVLNVRAVAVFVFGLVTLAVLAIASRNNRNIPILTIVQTLALAAAPLGVLDW